MAWISHFRAESGGFGLRVMRIAEREERLERLYRTAAERVVHARIAFRDVRHDVLDMLATSLGRRIVDGVHRHLAVSPLVTGVTHVSVPLSQRSWSARVMRADG